MKFEFSRRVVKKNQVSNFMKNRPVGAELLHAAWLTRGEANSRFPQSYEKSLKISALPSGNAGAQIKKWCELVRGV